ncbi:hypothetical protein JVT61DRAFT_8336 [Boletus reticuloceps]|uniref:Hydrophobin n=1 Tax=Boletus reticuloceps TaxID=495285 RepID=A0A8I2YVG9_9AGAM|nr:hypothetical protein JVT61DRAFT_8336 [Boletus reticuloceps]
MFIRLSTIFFSVVALVGVATAVPTDLVLRDTCNSGSVNCCQSVQSIIELFGYLGLPMPAGGTQIGLTCSPVTLGGSSTGSICTQQTVCCTGNTFVSPSVASHFACTSSDVDSNTRSTVSALLALPSTSTCDGSEWICRSLVNGKDRIADLPWESGCVCTFVFGDMDL